MNRIGPLAFAAFLMFIVFHELLDPTQIWVALVVLVLLGLASIRAKNGS